MSAKIIRFIARPKQDGGQTDFPTIAFRSPLPEPAVNPVAAAPDKHAGPRKREA